MRTMIYSLHLYKIRWAMMLALVAFLSLVMVSCGSYQQASYYENDGIYSNGKTTVTTERPQQGQRYQTQEETNTYADYFEQKAGQYNDVLESEVFTDVDSYSSSVENDSISESQLMDYYDNGNDYAGYGGWGDNTTGVNINIYGGAGYGMNGFGGPWGWNNWGWGGYGYGYGWGGFYNPWYYNPWGWGGYGYGYGWGWGGYYNPWYYPRYGYGYGYYGNRSYAYNTGRRGYYDRNTLAGVNSRALRARTSTSSRGDSPRYRTSGTARSSTARSTALRSSRTSNDRISTNRRSVGVDRNQAYRTSRSTRTAPKYSSSSSKGNTYRRSAPSTSTSRRTVAPRTSTYSRSSSTTRNQSYRSSAPRTSSYRSSSPSSGSSRSSGAVRSSGSSSRSSGGTRSSGGSGRRQ